MPCAQVVISSSFESSVGLSHLAQLAVAADADWTQSGGPVPPLAHGLGTSHWLTANLAHLPLLSAAPEADATTLAAPNAALQADPVAATAATGSGPDGSSGSGGDKGLPNGVAMDTAQRPVVDVAAAATAGLLASEPVAPAPFLRHTTELCGVHGSYHFIWTAAGFNPTADAARISMGLPLASGRSRTAAAQPLTVLLHGFLGVPDDWRSIMAGLAAAGRPCVAIGLPGSHGKAIKPHLDAGGLLSMSFKASCVLSPVTHTSRLVAGRTLATCGEDSASCQELGCRCHFGFFATLWTCASTAAPADSVEAVADVLADQLRSLAGGRPVQLVGYSLGGRLALALSMRHPTAVERLVIVSGSPGLAGKGWNMS